MLCVNAELAYVQHLKFHPWPREQGQDVEFRLIYRGPLPAQGAGTGGSRVEEKHAIRRHIHSQMRELWRGHPMLSPYVDEQSSQFADLRPLGSKFERCGYLFLPLVSRQRGIACSLDILFLRRDNPGNLIASGGDVDNRVKVLFDALRMPHEEEVKNSLPQQGERPFFCLLEDDALITDVRITTDRLLMPLEGDEHIYDVHLVVHVKTKIVDDRFASRFWA